MKKQGTLQRFREDERGMALVWAGLGMIAFMSAASLAIDVGLIMTSRSQAQNAADAGALAGATALVFNSYTNHTASGPAVTSAVSAASANLVASQAPSVTPADVTFPLDPVTGASNRVQVNVFRSAARGNPIPTFIAPIFGVTNFSVGATAIAAAMPANEENCVLPFTIPDKWIEHNCPPDTCPWTPGDSFDMYQTKGGKQNSGQPLANPDVYIPPGQPGATGFNPATDIGIQLVIKNNNQNKVAPSFYNPWDLPGSVGGSDYRTNIATCNPNLIPIGSNMTPENGNMVGPTKQGSDDLIAQDPGAYWDTTCNCVKGSAFGVSPRIRIMPLYNPALYASGQQTGKNSTLQVTNYIGMFVEQVTGGGDVTGRIAPILGQYNPNLPAATGGFAQAIMMVQ